MALYALMVGGGITVDAITNNMLPITVRHFTDNVAYIAVLAAMNRVCGTFIQPYAARVSDRPRGKLGRRRPFFLFAWPAVLLSVGLLGAMPFVLPAEMHRTTTALVLLFVVNLVMQATLDVGLGCGEPLYGDMFSVHELGIASGVRSLVFSVIAATMAYVAFPLADRHEFAPYAISMVFLLISTLIALVYLRESVPAVALRRERSEHWRTLFNLRDRRLAWVAVVASCTLTADALSAMLHALFVVETLGLTKADLGYAAALGVGMRFVFSYPAGMLVDRFGVRMVLIFGFLLFGSAAVGLAFFVHGLPGLYLGSALLAIGSTCTNVPIIPILFCDAPPERRGSDFAAVQFTRGVVVSVATIVMGCIADFASSFRVCYVGAACFCILGVVAAFEVGCMDRRRNSAPSDDVNAPDLD
ncbi:MAG: MFS transporter [Opitutaceae bacterium]|nr:MFS transporter [Opitutaceae bacterium]